MKNDALKPYGLALLDYFNGAKNATLLACRDDGQVVKIKIATFFRESIDQPIDKLALSNCRGRILDVGAGTGIHSLYLQNMGLNVTALDISPEACDIMKKRGLKNVVCADITDFKAEPFDTVILLGRSISMVETIDGLDDFLQDVHRLVKHTGQILLSSIDVRHATEPVHVAYYEENRKAGRYFGEIRLHYEYKDVRAPVHGVLYIDSDTLTKHALATTWTCEILLNQQDGNYLAKLALLTKD